MNKSGLVLDTGAVMAHTEYMNNTNHDIPGQCGATKVHGLGMSGVSMCSLDINHTNQGTSHYDVTYGYFETEA